MAQGKFISYLRVSTDKQGISGHGIEAQRTAIASYLNGGQWELLQEYTEVESGKKDDRPKLQEALRLCKLTGATLIIAKLDRLSRDPDFIGMMMKSDVDFIACDMPTANKVTIRFMSAIAEHEREMISQRTKVALEAAKTRGIKLGKPENATAEGRTKGNLASRKARQEKADSFASGVLPIISECHGMSLRMIAAELNSRNILTARGLTGSWTANGVKKVLDRANESRTVKL